ncbi:MAG TPA: TIGR00730 family Rossman fold protein [Nannocystis sp.]
MSTPRTFRRICVYCGSATGRDPVYLELARHVGEQLARRGIGIVYGGGKIGLMGALADAALRAGGQVYGVIPQKLRDIEVGHDGLTELFVVDSMHARKMMMAQLSDAFIALPGGFGTLEELFETTTWLQLSYHRKPVGLLNAHGYFDHLLAFLDHAEAQGFLRPQHRAMLPAAPDLDALLAVLAEIDLPQFMLHPPPRP